MKTQITLRQIAYTILFAGFTLYSCGDSPTAPQITGQPEPSAETPAPTAQNPTQTISLTDHLGLNDGQMEALEILEIQYQDDKAAVTQDPNSDLMDDLYDLQHLFEEDAIALLTPEQIIRFETLRASTAGVYNAFSLIENSTVTLPAEQVVVRAPKTSRTRNIRDVWEE